MDGEQYSLSMKAGMNFDRTEFWIREKWARHGLGSRDTVGE